MLSPLLDPSVDPEACIICPEYNNASTKNCKTKVTDVGTIRQDDMLERLEKSDPLKIVIH